MKMMFFDFIRTFEILFIKNITRKTFKYIKIKYNNILKILKDIRIKR